MRRTIGQVTIAAICAVCIGNHTSFADANDWNRFSVKDVKLGDHLSALVKKGFKTCKVPGTNPYYILILDKRCTGKSGGECSVDDKGVDRCEPFFNGKPAARGNASELEHIAVKVTFPLDGTPMDDPRVYEVNYYFPRQLLTDDSPLGKSLMAKYGKYCTDDPSCYNDGRKENDPAGGGRMVFTGSGGQRGPRLSVMCDGYQASNHVTTVCWMMAEDGSILDTDRKQQTDANMKKGEKSQPPPPKF